MSTPGKNPNKTVSISGSVGNPRPEFRARNEGLPPGKALRGTVQLERYGAWRLPPKLRNPIDALEVSNRHRLLELIPISCWYLLCTSGFKEPRAGGG
jgi:hypothetical protein